MTLREKALLARVVSMPPRDSLLAVLVALIWGLNFVVIDEGLSGGELVIVDGLQRVRPGIAVRASPAAPAASRT